MYQLYFWRRDFRWPIQQYKTWYTYKTSFHRKNCKLAEERPLILKTLISVINALAKITPIKAFQNAFENEVYNEMIDTSKRETQNIKWEI